MRRPLTRSVGAAALLSALAIAGCGGGGSYAPAPTATTQLPNPVLLLHGWAGHATAMEPMRTNFEQEGVKAFSIELPGNDNVANAEAIATKVSEIKSQTGASKVDLVGYSMGGLSARYYIKRLNGAASVGAYVAFGTPQYGGDIACALDETNGGQMCPGSAFLNDLNDGDDTPGNLSYTTIWSVDEVPESAGHLDGGACFVSIPGIHHVDEPASQDIFNVVLQAIHGDCLGTVETQPIR